MSLKIKLLFMPFSYGKKKSLKEVLHCDLVNYFGKGFRYKSLFVFVLDSRNRKIFVVNAEKIIYIEFWDYLMII